MLSFLSEDKATNEYPIKNRRLLCRSLFEELEGRSTRDVRGLLTFISMVFPFCFCSVSYIGHCIHGFGISTWKVPCFLCELSNTKSFTRVYHIHETYSRDGMLIIFGNTVANALYWEILLSALYIVSHVWNFHNYHENRLTKYRTKATPFLLGNLPTSSLITWILS